MKIFFFIMFFLLSVWSAASYHAINELMKKNAILTQNFQEYQMYRDDIDQWYVNIVNSQYMPQAACVVVDKSRWEY